MSHLPITKFSNGNTIKTLLLNGNICSGISTNLIQTNSLIYSPNGSCCGLLFAFLKSHLLILIFSKERILKETLYMLQYNTQFNVKFEISNGSILNALLSPEVTSPIHPINHLFYSTTGKINNKLPKINYIGKINQPFNAGYINIDTTIPIGCGQKMAIIGNNNSGKSTLINHILLYSIK